MSKRAFIICGFVIIQLYVTTIAIIMYLAFSKIIDVTNINPTQIQALFCLPIIAFGIILYLRFKAVLHQKRIWTLSILLYLVFTIVGVGLTYLYMTTVFMESGAVGRFFDAIHDWAKNNETGTEMSWTVKQKLDFILIWSPMGYLTHLGLFALLWFGSLDPNTPSKNQILQRLKRALISKSEEKIGTGDLSFATSKPWPSQGS